MTGSLVAAARAQESARNRFGLITHACFWEFPYQPEAKKYEVIVKDASGRVLQVYQLHQSDVEATPATTIPILTSDDPFPPAIRVVDVVKGATPASFYRRGTTIRYLLVWGSGFNANFYYDNNPITVMVYFEER